MKEAIYQFILSKAREVFEDKGFHQATIEEIAQSSDLSKPTLYKYFNGKEDIFWHVVDDVNCELNDLLLSVLQDAQPFETRLRALIRTFLKHVYENRGILKIVFYESQMFFDAVSEHPEGGLRTLLKKREERLDMIERFFTEGVNHGLVVRHVPVRLLVYFFVGVLGEFALGVYFNRPDHEPVDIDAMSDSFMQILTHGIYSEKARRN